MRYLNKLVAGISIGLFLASGLEGQSISNERQKALPFQRDSIKIDTGTIIPNSLKIYKGTGEKLNPEYYRLNNTTGYLIWEQSPPIKDSLKVIYRVFPLNFTREYSHKSKSLMDSTVRFDKKRKIYRPETKDEKTGFKSLERNGNIARGITMGNNQDLTLNSNLDLQLSGQLTEKIGIKGAVTDQNLPIEPEGNSAKIQDFDRVFIKLTTENEILNLGDFKMKPSTQTDFMNFYKKSQGIGFGGNWELGENKTLEAGADLGFSRGKFARNVINAREGNQGPYQLKGNENETYIIIISGTERIFLNGKELKRGRQNDYTIDYNSGEITFTKKHLITQYDRIIAEFQYSKRNYERSIAHTYGTYKTDHLKLSTNLFSEQDHKNSPLFQELSKKDKQKMANVGDSIDQAVISGEKQKEFDQDKIMYKKTDTLGFEEVFVYSTNPDKARYEVNFTRVGRNNGNYRQITTKANGRIFAWIKPKNGQPQGNYAPVKKLVTPKKQQMASVKAQYKFSENFQAGVEWAGSNRDLNTFSEIDNNDDKGQATKAFLKKTFQISDKENPWEAKTHFSFEYNDKTFIPIERYRPVEFQRKWQRTLKNPKKWKPKTERLANIRIGLDNNNNFSVNYHFDNFSRGTTFTGRKHKANLNWNWKNFELFLKNNLTNVASFNPNGKEKSTTFLRQKGQLKHHLGPITLGGGYKREKAQNQIANKFPLDSNSYRFRKWHILAKSPDSFQNTYQIKYTKRQDFLPSKNESFTKATNGTNINLKGNLKGQKDGNYLNYDLTYREFKLKDSTFRSQNLPGTSITGALEGNYNFLDDVFNTSTYYELGSGKELKSEYQFIRVRGEGRGNYVWKDYNNNQIQELDEFQPATEANDHKANFIRVITPTNEFIRSISNELRENISITPKKVWREEEGIKKWVGKFSNETNLRIKRKVLNRNRWQQYFPFKLDVSDSNLVQVKSSLKNTLYFNKTDPLFGLYYQYDNQKRKALRVRGIDQTTREINTIHGRLNVSKKWTFLPEYKIGRKRFNSQFFENKNYNIHFNQAKATIDYQPIGKLRFSLNYKHGKQENTFDTAQETSTENKIGLEGTFNFIGKGTLRTKISYIHFDFNGNPNSPVGYEMLQGMSPGENWTWFLSFNYQLRKNLQLNVNYNGRTSQATSVIHQANVSARYLF